MKDTVKNFPVTDTKVSMLVDKLTISYAYGEVPTAEEDYARMQLFKYSVIEGEFGPGGKVWKSSKGPFTTISQPLPSGSGFVVRYGYSVNQHRAWLTVNPSKLTAEDVEMFQVYLQMIFTDGSGSLWQHGKVQRIDFAVDVEGAHFDECAFLDRRLRRGSAVFQTKGTSYLGARYGARVLACYDKSREVFAKTGQHIEPMLRLEARLEPNLKLKEFEQCANPFCSLAVIDRSQLLNAHAAGSAFAKLVLAGMPADSAYWSCHPKARPQLWQQILQMQPHWWKPDEIWEQAVLDNSISIF